MTRTPQLDRPAVEGGQPVRETMLPLAQPRISEQQIEAVAETLRSGWIATGRKTESFEREFADYVGNEFGVGLTSGTAALALALELAGVSGGDEVITTSLTFVATANEVVHRGATPVFADIDPETLNLDPRRVEERVTDATRAILLVHYAGRPCDMGAFAELAKRHGLVLISDSAHSIESRAGGRKLAEWSSLNAFSFHPIKNLTTGEGGMLTTDNEAWAARARQLRHHGISRDAWSRNSGGNLPSWDVEQPGYKYNMSDIQAALGLGQLAEIEANHSRRSQIAAAYSRAFASIEGLAIPAAVAPGERHAFHLYPLVLDPPRLGIDRDRFREALHAENIGSGHHYPAVHRLTYFRERFDLDDEQLPHAASVADRIVSLPLHLGMSDDDVEAVVDAVTRVVRFYR